jgi:hypothetical protein
MFANPAAMAPFLSLPGVMFCPGDDSVGRSNLIEKRFITTEFSALLPMNAP